MEDLIRNHLRFLTLLHSERPKLHRVLAILSAIGLRYIPDIGAYCLLCWKIETFCMKAWINCDHLSLGMGPVSRKLGLTK